MSLVHTRGNLISADIECFQDTCVYTYAGVEIKNGAVDLLLQATYEDVH